MASEAYFGWGTTLAGIVNLETVITTPASTFPEVGGSPMALMGGTARRLLSGKLDRSGSINGALAYPVMDNGQDDLNALTLALFGNYTTPSKQLYIITYDTTGHYTPWLCWVDAPYIGENFTYSINAKPRSIIVPLRGGILQQATKTSNYTITTADHYLIANTSGGNITLAINAISGFNSDVPYIVYKSSASNNLVFDPNSSEQINGSSTLTVTALGWTTIIKSGSAWVTI